MKTYPSPFMTSLVTIGICLCAVAPPLGILFIVLGIFEQRRLSGGHRRQHQARLAVAREARLDQVWRYFR